MGLPTVGGWLEAFKPLTALSIVALQCITAMPRRSKAGRSYPGKWRLPGIGVCRLRKPSDAAIAEVSSSWPPLRPKNRSHSDWDWQEAIRRTNEVFALVDDTRTILALWCSRKPLVQLEGKEWYRADYLEVHPLKPRNSIGSLAASLVAKRAADLGRAGVVLMSTEEATTFYEALSGTRRLPAGWSGEKGLVPFVFEGDSFLDLQGISDELEDDAEE